MSKVARFAALGVTALLIVGCGPKLEGKYAPKEDKANLAQAFTDIQLEFKPGNKANYSVKGFGTSTTIEVDYEVSGKELKLKTPEGTQIANNLG